MKVFVLQVDADGERELIGEYAMQQIPHAGEKLLTRVGEQVHRLPVLEVRHFLMGEGSLQGAFIDVGQPEITEVPAEIAALFVG